MKHGKKTKHDNYATNQHQTKILKQQGNSVTYIRKQSLSNIIIKLGTLKWWRTFNHVFYPTESGEKKGPDSSGIDK